MKQSKSRTSFPGYRNATLELTVAVPAAKDLKLGTGRLKPPRVMKNCSVWRFSNEQIPGIKLLGSEQFDGKLSRFLNGYAMHLQGADESPDSRKMVAREIRFSAAKRKTPRSQTLQ